MTHSLTLVAAVVEASDFIPPLWRVLTKSAYFGGVGFALGAVIVHLAAVRPSVLPTFAGPQDSEVMRGRSGATMGFAGLVLLAVLYPQLAGKVARAGDGMPFGDALVPSAVWEYLLLPPKAGEWISVGNMAFVQFSAHAVFAAILVMLLIPRTRERIDSVAWVAGVGITAASLVLIVPRNFSTESPIGFIIHLLALLHPLSGGVWLGGIFALTALVFSRRKLSLDGGVVWMQIWKRFTVVAQVCVGILLVSGLWLAWEAVGSIPQLWETPYGRFLLLKTSLVLALIATGIFNEFVLLPKAMRLRARGDERGLFSLVLHHFPRTVAVEAVLALGVLAVVPFLNGSSREQVGGEADPAPTAGILVAVALLFVFGAFSFVANAKFHRLQERKIDAESQDTPQAVSVGSRQ